MQSKDRDMSHLDRDLKHLNQLESKLRKELREIQMLKSGIIMDEDEMKVNLA